WAYDQVARRLSGGAAELPLGAGGVRTSWFQFSKTRDGERPTPFGVRYAGDLKAAARITTWLNAPVTALRLSPDGRRIARLEVRAGEKRLTVRPRATVVAAGAVENARLLLA